MTPVQEIKVCTNQNAVLTLRIAQARPGSLFTAEMVIVDANFPTGDPVPIKGTFSLAGDAFDTLLSGVRMYCQNNNEQTVEAIDNPCNCEFLSSQAQQAIVSHHGIEVNVTVNATAVQA